MLPLRFSDKAVRQPSLCAVSQPVSSPPAIIDVSTWLRFSDEQMGSKQKFWCRDNQQVLWLFKYPRRQDGEGEDWSEWLAAQIASRLLLPHAEVQLARYNESRGVIVRDFTEDRRRGELVHGNQLLLRLDASYPAQQRFRVVKHTVGAIFGVLEQDFIELPSGDSPLAGIATAADLFVGYLLLDAIIGNTDRHHENWAILELTANEGMIRRSELAPTFDHASCLGREVSDEKRIARLGSGRPDQTIMGYVQRTRSRIFGSEEDSHALHPIQVLQLACARRPSAGRAWLEFVRSIPIEEFEVFVAQVPTGIMSDPARQFATRMLELNLQRIIDLRI